MVRAHRALADEGLKTRLILQIHDELLAEGPDEEAEKAAEVISREMVARRRPRPAAEGRRRLGPELARGQVVDKGVAVAVAAVVGGLVVTQAPLNSQLGRVVGSVNASAVALAVSCVALLALAAVTDGLGGIRNIGDAPLHVAIGGGLAGALYVGSIVFTVRALGAGGLTAVTIAGQLGLAVVIDHFGWLGVERSPITVAKVAGVVLLAVGTWLVIRE